MAIATGRVRAPYITMCMQSSFLARDILSLVINYCEAGRVNLYSNINTHEIYTIECIHFNMLVCKHFWYIAITTNFAIIIIILAHSPDSLLQ